MKKLLLLIPFSILGVSNVNAQCSPVDCSASLPSYGGTCDSMLMGGDVNVPYSDFESFVMNDQCFDAGVFDPTLGGTDIAISLIHDITFSSMPAGITAVTNQATYDTSGGGVTLGCASFTGTPTEAGVFNDSIKLLVDVWLCPVFLGINLDDQNASYVMWMTINPDPSFTGLAPTYNTTDASVPLTITGNTGGVFSGPGVVGSTFDPALAGAGTHTIKYLVSAMEGAAIAPATDSMEVVVDVSILGLEANVLDAVTLFPNPANDVLSINGLVGNTEEIQISDASGKMMLSQVNINTSSFDMNVENLEAGIYFVRITQNNNARVIRFAKQ